MRISKRFRKFICLLLSIIVVVIMLPNNSICSDSDANYYSVIQDNIYEVNISIKSLWDNGAQLECVIRNVGEHKIDNWHLTSCFPFVISDIWNATILESDNCGVYTIKNAEYNQDIPVGGSVSFGMIVCFDINEGLLFPDWYLLNTKKTIVDSLDYKIEYQEYSSWVDGFNGVLLLEANERIEDWSLEFSSEYKIDQISNAIICNCTENNYKILNDGINQNLTNQTTYIFIQGVPTKDVFSLSNITLSSISLAYSIDEDLDDNGLLDYMEFISICNGDSTIMGENPIDVTIEPTGSSFSDSGIIELFLEEKVFKSNSGEKTIEVLSSIGSEKSIKEISIYNKTEKTKNAMEEKNTYGNLFYTDLVVDTEYDGSTMKRMEYECICVFTDGEIAQKTFDISIVNSEDLSFYYTVYVNEYLFDYIDSEYYIKADTISRRDKCLEILSNMESKGCIEEGSVYDNEVGYTISYIPTGDSLHFISYADYDQSYSSIGFNSLLKNSIPTKDWDNTLHITSNYDLLILFAFEDSRIGDYNSLINHFNEDGSNTAFFGKSGAYLNTHIELYPSLEDYAHGIDNSTITIIASHGSLITSHFLSCCHTRIVLCGSDDKELIDSLKEQYDFNFQFAVFDRAKDQYEICLLPDFFREQYANNELNNTIVLLDNCYSGSINSTYDQGSLVNAMAFCGSPFSSGYSGVVTNIYENEYDISFIEKVYERLSFYEAYKYASRKIDEERATNNVDLRHVYGGTNIYGYIEELVYATPSDTPSPTVVTPIVTPEEHNPIDVWFICESTDNFGMEQINQYEIVMKYIMENGNYFIGKDHVGVGYSAYGGTAFTYYSYEGLDYYQNLISTVKSRYSNMFGHLGTSVSSVNWFLCTYWSNQNSRVQESEKFYNTRPDIYDASYYVFFVDPSTTGYIDDRYIDEAIDCLSKYNVKVFFVNLGSEPLSNDLVEFAHKTGGDELSSSPQKMWNELLDYQKG